MKANKVKGFPPLLVQALHLLSPSQPKMIQIYKKLSKFNTFAIQVLITFWNRSIKASSVNTPLFMASLGIP